MRSLRTCLCDFVLVAAARGGDAAKATYANGTQAVLTGAPLASAQGVRVVRTEGGTVVVAVGWARTCSSRGCERQ